MPEDNQTDAVTLGRLRRDLERNGREIMLLVDPESGFAVAAAQGRGAQKLSAAIKTFSQLKGEAAAVAELAKDGQLSRTLDNLRNELPENAVETVTRNDEAGKFLNLSASGDAAEFIYNKLLELGLVAAPAQAAKA